MTAVDPFSTLGLDRRATAEDVRRARRELAKAAHPDVGGEASAMRAINDAAAAALRLIAARTTSASTPVSDRPDDRPPERTEPGPGWGRGGRDAPSFTVEALPVETFEALLLAAAALGEVEDDDPPYGLHVLMAAPLPCWCHLSIVPDAGSSTVSISVAPEPDATAPPVESVRDAWIAELNSLDWSALG